jgi:hypothetical protein
LGSRAAIRRLTVATDTPASRASSVMLRPERYPAQNAAVRSPWHWAQFERAGGEALRCRPMTQRRRGGSTCTSGPGLGVGMRNIVPSSIESSSARQGPGMRLPAIVDPLLRTESHSRHRPCGTRNPPTNRNSKRQDLTPPSLLRLPTLASNAAEWLRRAMSRSLLNA